LEPRLPGVSFQRVSCTLLGGAILKFISAKRETLVDVFSVKFLPDLPISYLEFCSNNPQLGEIENEKVNESCSTRDFPLWRRLDTGCRGSPVEARTKLDRAQCDAQLDG
jgi:hypothetical protein